MEEACCWRRPTATSARFWGWAFPPIPAAFCFIDGIGLAQFVARADRLADLFGEQLRPPQLLRDMAAKARPSTAKSAKEPDRSTNVPLGAGQELVPCADTHPINTSMETRHG